SEVKTLLKDYDLFYRYEEVREWYNGYIFGKRVIYNPWSIINFLGSKEKELQPYWLNTSDNAIVESLLTTGGKELKKELDVLISGDSIQKNIDENIVLKSINKRENLLWSFLLMGGYLKQTDRERDTFTGRVSYTLSIPNLEVREIYTTIVEEYFYARTESEDLENMLNALVEGDIKRFETMLKKIVLSVFSFHDFGNKSEKVYHALVAGLLVWISKTHQIKSNRESGYGRYDIMIFPRNPSRIGYVIEFKAVDKDDNETMEDALEKALKQIEEKKYETELVDRGIKQIKKLAIAFSGKEVCVKEADL
ncbi:MAG: AAA family ATPase, partial [bacterium]|nr:AAA family ATPase [bacterium]